jgi:hypothetical protein
MDQPSGFTQDNGPLFERDFLRQITQDASDATRVEASTGGNLR